ncbi:hypothetical protein WN51_05127 [Melipona quadrifasciata]|uniref:Uncharacterized protein n=1 Tax=Melipona quadrifasciata TaxID=166423 RepID=A0A0M8ZTZ2_9HYME|nr:hypothetical protein WN51_05127 [Melipona quadrifasciata]
MKQEQKQKRRVTINRFFPGIFLCLCQSVSKAIVTFSHEYSELVYYDGQQNPSKAISIRESHPLFSNGQASTQILLLSCISSRKCQESFLIPCSLSSRRCCTSPLAKDRSQNRLVWLCNRLGSRDATQGEEVLGQRSSLVFIRGSLKVAEFLVRLDFDIQNYGTFSLKILEVFLRGADLERWSFWDRSFCENRRNSIYFILLNVEKYTSEMAPQLELKLKNERAIIGFLLPKKRRNVEISWRLEGTDEQARYKEEVGIGHVV